MGLLDSSFYGLQEPVGEGFLGRSGKGGEVALLETSLKNFEITQLRPYGVSLIVGHFRWLDLIESTSGQERRILDGGESDE